MIKRRKNIVNKEEALKQLSEKIEQVKTILNECRAIAKENKLKLVNPEGYYDEDEVESKEDKKFLKSNLLSKILTKKEWKHIGCQVRPVVKKENEWHINYQKKMQSN